jgi:2-methylcitrate dehydratase
LTNERIGRRDVQELLHKVNVHTKSPIHKPLVIAGLLDPYTEAYPDKLYAKVIVTFNDNREISLVKSDFHGFYTRPFDWTDVENKFRRLSRGALSSFDQERLIRYCTDLENESVPEVVQLLSTVAVNLAPVAAVS